VTQWTRRRTGDAQRAWRLTSSIREFRAHKASRFVATVGAVVLSNLGRTVLGVLFWLVATRAFAASDVGLAAAAASAMMLCMQLALLGTDWAGMALYPQHRLSPGSLLRWSLTIVLVSGVCAGGLFLLVASQALHELSVVAMRPLFAVAFVAACVLGSLALLADSFSIAMWRPGQIMMRSIAIGLLTLGSLGVFVIFGSNRSAERLFSCWLIGYAGAFVLSAVYFSRAARSWTNHAGSLRVSMRRILRAGLPNYSLGLAEQAPGLAMPVVVTELLSPETNAYWYTIWLGAVSVYIIPGAAASALFAQVSDSREGVGTAIRRTLAVGLGFGVLGASLLAALAPVVLALLGDGYADAGTTPLRILVVGVIPLTFFFAYLALSRAMRRFREAVPVAIAAGVLILTAGAIAGTVRGLVGIACTWVTIHFALGLWGAWRLRALTRAVRRTTAAERSEVSAPAGLGAIMRRET
jgi:O-antigen/teichoic acid export membrane protein